MILLVGYLGKWTNVIGGQTVKTRDIYKLLLEAADGKVEAYDTDEFKRNKLSLLKMFWKIIRCDTLCYLPSKGNLRVMFPIIYLLTVLFRVKIHYFVVGGWLDDFLKNLPLHRRMLVHIAGIYVETHKLEQKLRDTYHFGNVDVFPNFRFFNYDIGKYDACKPVKECAGEGLRIAFISRVEQCKGLDTLCEISSLLVSKGFRDRVTFELYGPKMDGYFDANMCGNTMFEYKGVLKPDEVTDILKGYDALIFPSHYEGEGCPGILIEALSVGMPIIASDWKYNDEFVENEVNGFLCDVLNAGAYVDAIMDLMENVDKRMEMARNSYIKSQQFSVCRAKKLLSDMLRV